MSICELEGDVTMGKTHEGAGHEHKKPDAAGHEHKKPDEHKKADGGGSHATPQSKAKGHTPLPDGCHAWGCKSKSKRFNFCDEHYDHFKFGLIKKTGQPVPDYEKKIEHYLVHKARTGAHKVA